MLTLLEADRSLRAQEQTVSAGNSSSCSSKEEDERTLPESQRRVADDAPLAAGVGGRVDLRVDERVLAQLGDRRRVVRAGIDARHELAELEVLLLAERGEDGRRGGVGLGVLCEREYGTAVSLQSLQGQGVKLEEVDAR